jgi:hypothetical protein
MLMIRPLRRGIISRDALQAEEHALRVHPMDAVPVRLGQVHDVGAAGHPGVVHQDVDLAVGLDHMPHHAVDVGHVTNIRLHAQGAALRRADLVRRGLRLVAGDVGHNHRGPRLGQRLRGRLADALGRPGHQRHLMGQCHATSPPLRRQSSDDQLLLSSQLTQSVPPPVHP